MATKANPYSGSTSQGTKAGALTTPGSSEPLFRKARLAQHLKEMVKVPLGTQAHDKQGVGPGPGNYSGGRYGGGGYDDATISTTKSAPSGMSSMQQTTVMGGMGGHHHTPTHAPYGGSNGQGGNNQGNMNNTPMNALSGSMSSANYTGPSSQNHQQQRMINSNTSSGKSLRMHSGNTIDTTTVTQPYDNMNVNNHRR